jgi:hypothetical protein
VTWWKADYLDDALKMSLGIGGERAGRSIVKSPAGLSQRSLASKLKRSGSFVWKLESQEHRVDVLEFIDIARAMALAGERPAAWSCGTARSL